MLHRRRTSDECKSPLIGSMGSVSIPWCYVPHAMFMLDEAALQGLIDWQCTFLNAQMYRNLCCWLKWSNKIYSLYHMLISHMYMYNQSEKIVNGQEYRNFIVFLIGNMYCNIFSCILTLIVNITCLLQKRRTLRQTLQRQREEQQAISQQAKQPPEGNGSAGGEGHFKGHRLSYTEATGSKLYAPPPTLPKPTLAQRTAVLGNPVVANRSVTISNPTFSVENQDDNMVW